MASSTYLSNPGEVLIGAVDVTDQCTAATFTFEFDTLENTAFGQTARTNVAGLENNTVTLTMYMSYAVSRNLRHVAAAGWYASDRER
jgi:hypothetical protein